MNQQTMHDYELLEALGGGKYSRVCRALDKVNKREVAIKKVDLSLIDPKAELQALKDLSLGSTAYVVRLHNYFYDDDQDPHYMYIVLDIVQGITINTLINKWADEMDQNKERSLILVWVLIGHLLRAVNYLHNELYAHNDLHGDNIFWDGSTIKIIDFGYARPIQDPDYDVLHDKVFVKNTITNLANWYDPDIVTESHTNIIGYYQDEQMAKFIHQLAQSFDEPIKINDLLVKYNQFDRLMSNLV